MKTAIVLGLGFGDEGKGITTDYLCRQSKDSLVIRFSGGHQAGHTVVDEEGKRHVFSNFGSGTLRAVPTYWSAYCTFFPSAFKKEWEALQGLGVCPTVFVDALCPVTTPYDVFYNQLTERSNQHGSCGVGFGATIRRSLSPYKLYAQDLLYSDALSQKLKAIGRYYENLGQGVFSASSLKHEVRRFKEEVAGLRAYLKIVQGQDFFDQISCEQLIFEGSQGILLDMDHGFFPNVTFAHTSSRNAMELINRYKLPRPEIFYITRAYQTRHGNGYLSNEGRVPNYQPNQRETNQFNEWQGTQRVSILDVDMLRYALQSDANYSSNLKKHLIITCMDQLTGSLQATLQEEVLHFDSTNELLSYLPQINGDLIESHSDCSRDMKIVNAIHEVNS